MDDAFGRLCRLELGISMSRDQASFIGPFEHFYTDYVFGEDVTTHYVVLGYQINLDIELSQLPQEQHNEYALFSHIRILDDGDVHTHSKCYVS